MLDTSLYILYSTIYVPLRNCVEISFICWVAYQQTQITFLGHGGRIKSFWYSHNSCLEMSCQFELYTAFQVEPIQRYIIRKENQVRQMSDCRTSWISIIFMFIGVQRFLMVVKVSTMKYLHEKIQLNIIQGVKYSIYQEYLIYGIPTKIILYLDIFRLKLVYQCFVIYKNDDFGTDSEYAYYYFVTNTRERVMIKIMNKNLQ